LYAAARLSYLGVKARSNDGGSIILVVVKQQRAVGTAADVSAHIVHAEYLQPQLLGQVHILVPSAKKVLVVNRRVRHSELQEIWHSGHRKLSRLDR
jgi:hypothetical protein